MNQETGLDAYKIVLYRQDDGAWVAEVPAIAGLLRAGVAGWWGTGVAADEAVREMGAH